MIRTDSIGDTLWTRKYGGSDYDNGISVQQTSDGGFVVVGWTQSFGAGSRDVYLIKTNSIGDTLWTRTYGGTGDDRGYSVKETQDGGYIIGGFTKSYGAGLADIYVIKTNSLGFPTGARTFGNADEDRGYSIQETSDGGYIITGYIGSFGSVERDIYIIKTDAVLDTVWTLKRDILGYDEGYSIQETSNGGYIITGCTNCNSLSNSIVFLMKIDTLGNPLWIRPFTGTSGSWGYSGQQTTDGGYVITGYTNYGVNGWLTDVYLIKTDGDGLVGVEEESNKYRTPDIEFRLFQNFLNPFHRTTLIRYQIASSNHVTLTVYDITGRMMETLVNEKKDPGVYQLEWDGKDQSSGIYFYRLHCNDFITTKKMILLR